MIKNFFSGIKGPKLFSCLFFMGLGMLVILISIKEYKEHSGQAIEGTGRTGQPVEDLSFEELQAIFPSTDISSGDYQVVARKNLFSPDRQAWEPPSDAEDEQQRAKSSHHPRIDPGAFKLYGITNINDKKQVLIYYQHLADINKHRLVGEGETVYQDDDLNTELFRVAKIDRESVTIETGTGAPFEIGLYAHERQIVSTDSPDQVSIIIGGDSSMNTDQVKSPPSPKSQGKTAGSVPEDNKPSGSQENINRRDPVADTDEKETDTKDEAAQTDPRPANPLEALQKMMDSSASRGERSSSENLERQVQEGTMRRMDTPFGPIYRPVQ